jgi:hypothetical protein
VTLTSETSTTPTPTPAAEEAGPDQLVAQYVRERLQGTWAGDCDRTNVLTDTGKYCAKFAGERDGVRAYRIGQTFSEPVEWAFVDKLDGEWRIARTEQIQDPNVAPGVPWPLKIGDKVVVAGTGSCLNVRAQPAPNAPVWDCLRDGFEVTVMEGPRVVEGRRWWLLDDYGWGVDAFLRYPDALPGRQ